MNSFTKRLVYDDAKHTYTVDGVKLPSVTSIVAPIKAGDYEVDNAVLNQAKERGSKIHEKCADYDFGAISEESSVNPDIAAYLKGWIDFSKDYQPEWLYIEQQMCVSDYAGTVDRIGIIDGKPVVVDIKTTTSMDRASKIALCAQIAGYVNLTENNTDLKIETKDCFGVQLKRDGTYTVIRVKDVETKYNFRSFCLFAELLGLKKLVKGDKRVVTE